MAGISFEFEWKYVDELMTIFFWLSFCIGKIYIEATQISRRNFPLCVEKKKCIYHRFLFWKLLCNIENWKESSHIRHISPGHLQDNQKRQRKNHHKHTSVQYMNTNKLSFDLVSRSNLDSPLLLMTVLHFRSDDIFS